MDTPPHFLFMEQKEQKNKQTKQYKLKLKVYFSGIGLLCRTQELLNVRDHIRKLLPRCCA